MIIQTKIFEARLRFLFKAWMSTIYTIRFCSYFSVRERMRIQLHAKMHVKSCTPE